MEMTLEGDVAKPSGFEPQDDKNSMDTTTREDNGDGNYVLEEEAQPAPSALTPAKYASVYASDELLIVPFLFFLFFYLILYQSCFLQFNRSHVSG